MYNYNTKYIYITSLHSPLTAPPINKPNLLSRFAIAAALRHDTYVRAYTHIRAYMLNTHTHTYIHACTHIYMHTCIHTYIQTYMQTNKHTNMCTYIHPNTQKNAGTRPHTHTHTPVAVHERGDNLRCVGLGAELFEKLTQRQIVIVRPRGSAFSLLFENVLIVVAAALLLLQYPTYIRDTNHTHTCVTNIHIYEPRTTHVCEHSSSSPRHLFCCCITMAYMWRSHVTRMNESNI